MVICLLWHSLPPKNWKCHETFDVNLTLILKLDNNHQDLISWPFPSIIIILFYDHCYVIIVVVVIVIVIIIIFIFMQDLCISKGNDPFSDLFTDPYRPVKKSTVQSKGANQNVFSFFLFSPLPFSLIPEFCSKKMRFLYH